MRRNGHVSGWVWSIIALSALVAVGGGQAPPRSAPSVRPGISAVAFSPDGTRLALGRYREVELIDPATGRVLTTLGGLANQVRGLAFSADGGQLVAGSGNPGQFGEISVFDLAKTTATRTWRGHRDHITALVLAPDGSAIATASYDRTIRLWNPATGAELRVLRDHTDAVFALAFSPDGKFLASASADRTVKIWDPATGRRLFTLSDALDAVNALAFAADGRTLAGAGADRTIHLWQIDETGEGKRLRSLIAHEDAIVALAFSPDGKTLATSAGDRSLRLWNARTLVETLAVEPQSDWVQALAFSPDGQWIAAGRFDGTFHLYGAGTGRKRQP